MYHYTYMIEVKNPTDTRYQYLGVRSCSIKPEQDVYFGSCRPFKKWQQEHGTESLMKTVLARWPSREQALLHEILLHDIFDVARNKTFWNQAKQKTTGFDCSGVPKSKEHAKKIGRPKETHWSWGKKAKEETKKKMSLSHAGPNNAMYGKPVSDERKKKISEAQKGKKAWRYGKKFPEMAKKLSDIFKGKPKQKTTCPHCNLFGSVNNLKRYHFDNCKAKA